jgi:hypothetical protein
MTGLTAFWCPAETLVAIRGSETGWYGLDENGVAVIGPFLSQDELEAAAILAGYRIENP